MDPLNTIERAHVEAARETYGVGKPHRLDNRNEAKRRREVRLLIAIIDRLTGGKPSDADTSATGRR